jgi:DNA polymerase-3 subunit delta
MQLRPADLTGQLRGELAPVYLVTGDDPLLVQEACDAILDAARQAGFTERSVLYADGNFTWNDLAQDAASRSLFAERRLLDVRVVGGKVDKDASEVLRRYLADPNPDALLLLRLPRLDGRQRNSAWFKVVDQAGVVVTVWPIELRELPRWLRGRLDRAGVTLAPEALALLTERVEGNLLAAVQEIEKIRLADLPTPVSVEALQQVLEDSARYDAFELIDATLGGDGPRVSRMLATLRQEGVALFAILGALTSQLRAIASGGYVPGPRKRLVPAFLKRIGEQIWACRWPLGPR